MRVSRTLWARLAAILIAAAWLYCGTEEASARPVVSALEVEDGETRTRLVFSINSEVEFRIFKLANPDRVVVDMQRIRWRAGGLTVPVRSTLVRRVRYGVFTPETSRIVIDCLRPVRVERADISPTETGSGRTLSIVLAPVGVALPTRKDASPAVTTPAITTKVSGILLPPTRKPRTPSEPRIIVLDPGHGGVDPGATSVTGIQEKRLTLKAARRIRDKLLKTGRYRVVLTRDRDVFIRLRDRIEIARKADADAFLSLHADANPSPRVRGASVYTLSSKASDAEAAALAERENKADLIAGVDLNHETPEVANILIDLARRETQNQSSRLASALVRSLSAQTRMLRRSHRFAGFAVLKAPDVPSVLVEFGYLSNVTDEKLLRNPKHMDRLASAIARAIDEFFETTQVAERP